MKLNPELPVILCAGFSGPFGENSSRTPGIFAHVSKPLNVNEFAAVVRESLKQNRNQQEH